MTINTTNSIGQHKIPQRITQKQNTDLSCHTGSCMAHLNCLPPRAADVNFWFFVAVPFGGGCWYKAKCKMLLRKIDREMNVQNCGFFAKWRWWRRALSLTATAVITDSRHHFSKRWHVAVVKTIAGDNKATLMVHRNSANIACTFRSYVCLRLHDRDCCYAANCNSSCHAPAPLYFKEMTRCRHQKLHWRWPGNPNDRSKFRFIYVYMIATNAPAAAPRLMAASGDRSNGT